MFCALLLFFRGNNGILRYIPTPLRTVILRNPFILTVHNHAQLYGDFIAKARQRLRMHMPIRYNNLGMTVLVKELRTQLSQITYRLWIWAIRRNPGALLVLDMANMDALLPNLPSQATG